MRTTKLSLETASFRDLVAVAEAMLPDIAEAADEIDDARRLPGWLADRLAAAGFFHLLTGREHGGMEADPVTAARVIEMLSTASPSVGWVTMILAAASFWVVRMVPEQVRREIFADVKPGEIQPTVVAGTLVPHGRAVRADGGWRLSGQWPFASGCHHATWLPTAAWLYDEDGPIRDDDGAPQWRVFHLPASDCAILDTWYTSGLRGTGSTDYTMEDVFVADSYIKRHSLLEPPRLPDRRYAYPGFTVPLLSAVALGAARGSRGLAGGAIRRQDRPPQSAPSRLRPRQAGRPGRRRGNCGLGTGLPIRHHRQGMGTDHGRRGIAASVAGRHAPGLHPRRHGLGAGRGPGPLGGRSQFHIFGLPPGPVLPRRSLRGGPCLRAADHHGRWRPVAAGPRACLPGFLDGFSSRVF